MRQCRGLWPVAVMICITLPATGAQNLCQPLQATGGSQLQYKNRGNRCEGLYVQHIGAQGLAIVSFTLGQVSYSLVPATKLSVSVPGQQNPVWVRAIPKSASLGYEMDAQAASEEPLVWPVNDVLLPEHLTPSQLGVFAWKNDQGVEVFMPVSVSASVAGATASQGVFLSVRPSFDVQLLKWRWALATGTACGVPGHWQDGSNQTIDAGQTVTVRLPPTSGRHCIEFAAQGSTTDWLTTQFQVEEPAQ